MNPPTDDKTTDTQPIANTQMVFDPITGMRTEVTRTGSGQGQGPSLSSDSGLPAIDTSGLETSQPTPMVTEIQGAAAPVVDVMTGEPEAPPQERMQAAGGFPLPPVETQTPSAPVEIKKKKKKVLPVIGAVVALVFLAGAAAFALRGPQIISTVNDLRSRAAGCPAAKPRCSSGSPVCKSGGWICPIPGTPTCTTTQAATCRARGCSGCTGGGNCAGCPTAPTCTTAQAEGCRGRGCSGCTGGACTGCPTAPPPTCTTNQAEACRGRGCSGCSGAGNCTGCPSGRQCGTQGETKCENGAPYYCQNYVWVAGGAGCAGRECGTQGETKCVNGAPYYCQNYAWVAGGSGCVSGGGGGGGVPQPLANGVACTTGSQCASGNCIFLPGESAKTCQPAGETSPPTAGTQCGTQGETRCVSGISLYCQNYVWQTGGACMRANGAACTAGSQCASGNCIFLPGESAKTCQPAGEGGGTADTGGGGTGGGTSGGTTGTTPTDTGATSNACQNGAADRDPDNWLICECANGCSQYTDNTEGGGGTGWVCNENCRVVPRGTRPTGTCTQIDYVRTGGSNYCAVAEVNCPASCRTGGGGGGGTTLTTAPACSAVKVYVKDGENWVVTAVADLATKVKVGDTIRLAVMGSDGGFSQARFKINDQSPVTTTTQVNGEFVYDYTITAGGSYTIQGEVFTQ